MFPGVKTCKSVCHTAKPWELAALRILIFICYFILSYLILSYLILSYLILSYLILSYLILSYLILSYLISSHLISSHLILSHFIWSYLLLSYLISYYVILSHLILSHLILSHLILSHIISYYLISLNIELLCDTSTRCEYCVSVSMALCCCHWLHMCVFNSWFIISYSSPRLGWCGSHDTSGRAPAALPRTNERPGGIARASGARGSVFRTSGVVRVPPWRQLAAVWTWGDAERQTTEEDATQLNVAGARLSGVSGTLSGRRSWLLSVIVSVWAAAGGLTGGVFFSFLRVCVCGMWSRDWGVFHGFYREKKKNRKKKRKGLSFISCGVCEQEPPLRLRVF